MRKPKTAKYLLRFDDICPTMNWRVWTEIETILLEQGLKPVLAVVPDNQDPVLQVDARRDDFWDQARQWQARGWTMALHGFQHKYSAVHAGIVTPKKKTEFAGFPAWTQAEKLQQAVEIFERQRITPRVWIAPNDSFDRTTVALLPEFGIRIICDGFFRFPFVQREKLVWIPQQLYGFRPAPPGVWTVCYHHNDWTGADLARFREDVVRYRGDLWSLDEVLEAWAERRSRWPTWLYACPRLAHLVIRCELKLWGWLVASRERFVSFKGSLQPAEQSSRLI